MYLYVSYLLIWIHVDFDDLSRLDFDSILES